MAYKVTKTEQGWSVETSGRGGDHTGARTYFINAGAFYPPNGKSRAPARVREVVGQHVTLEFKGGRKALGACGLGCLLKEWKVPFEMKAPPEKAPRVTRASKEVGVLERLESIEQKLDELIDAVTRPPTPFGTGTTKHANGMLMPVVDS